MSAPAQEVTIPESEEAQVEELHQILRLGRATLTSPDGLHELHLPDAVYQLLMRIIKDLVEGKRISLTPGAQELTTQQAANYLGMSRQFLIGLLGKGEIPYRRVGAHRRLLYKDVFAYRKERDYRRHTAISEMAKEAIEAGVYDDL